MDRLIIQRKSNNIIRNTITKLLGSTIKDLRNFYNSEISTVLNKLDFTSPVVPDKLFNSDLFSEKDINDFLDYLYIDLLIQYGDVYTIRNDLERIRSLFIDTIIPQSIRAGEISSKVRNLKKLESTKYAFTDIISESFNQNINMYPYSEKLAINPGAGIIRLPGIEKNYSSPEYTNVKLNIISSGCKLVDSSDSLNVYNNDQLSPFYINAISTISPVNINKGMLEFEQHTGIICDLVIEFPDIVPVSRISFTQFSDAPFEIIQIQSSTMVNQNINYSSFEQITTRDISYDNNEVEINFDVINTRELHIFILQGKYKSTIDPVKIAIYKHISDYLAYCSKAVRSIDNKGFSENEDLILQLSELFKSIKDNTKFPLESIKENIRSYTVGLFNLKISNVIYYPTGYYTSDNYDVNGNIINVALSYDGIPTVETDDSIVAATLFNIETANNKIYLGSIDDNNKVYDISTLEINTSYIDGELEINTSYPIRFYTHFLPAIQSLINKFTSFTIYFDDEIITLSNNDYNIIQDIYTCTVELSEAIVKRYNLNEGITIITKYFTATSDCYGMEYSPSEVDIINRIGKPNIINHRILPVENSYLYVNTEISGVPYSTSYKENEWGRVRLSGEVYYTLGIGKGEVTDFPDIIKVSKDGTTNVYAQNMLCSIPIDNMYAAIFEEQIDHTNILDTPVINSQQYLMYKIDRPYVKNTIKIYDGSLPILDIEEYRDDEYTAEISTSVPLSASDDNLDKKTIFIKSGEFTDLKVYYVPIDGINMRSNIASHNITETFTSIPVTGMKLTRYPYLDMDIVNSDCFIPKDGVFTYQPLFSVVYEPIIIYVNGYKAKNITRYRTTDPEIDKQLASVSRDDEYMYYLTEDGIIIPNKDMTGTISVQYYSISDSLRAGIHMAKSNLYRDDLTPELYDFTILANTKR